MPYIKYEDKQRLVDNNEVPANAGELNWMLTQTCRNYFYTNGARYQQINDIIGAIECCKAEFQRRLVADYEDKKIAENGDVY